MIIMMMMNEIKRVSLQTEIHNTKKKLIYNTQLYPTYKEIYHIYIYNILIILIIILNNNNNNIIIVIL